MKIVVALGGNALLRRGQQLSAANQLANVRTAVKYIAKVAANHSVTITHGNGPQVGLLALQNDAYKDVPPYPLDVLDAQTQAMVGYMIEQELGNALPQECRITTVLTQVQVDPQDPAFEKPTKPIGPLYTKQQAEKLEAELGWDIAPDGDQYRRVVPSPKPQRIIELEVISSLIARGYFVVCVGGGGIPIVIEDGIARGVECVIDKDLASSMLARELDVDLFIIATDVEGVYLDWGTPAQRMLTSATVNELRGMDFATGSMAPKVQAACDFVEATGKTAVIGSLQDIEEIVAGTAGTRITV